jgi:hypothetical protein
MTAVTRNNSRVTNFVRFTADDWRAMAMYARAAAYRAEQDAAAQSNPSVRKTFLDEARRATERAEKCENAARVL